ncbi:MAG: acyl-CoA dehydrogenase, partial [Sphingopyxis sp.]|nr:acyl-CoA dehydrogenase [Sphingopyxis sp.]
VLEMTVTYHKERKQLVKLIGAFQGPQHRRATLQGEMEGGRGTGMRAKQLLDEGSEGAKLMVSVAKAKAGRAANLAVREGVQMHGGIGMTDEYDIGLYMKRDRALAEYMGDVHYHIDQVARMNGY